MRSLALVAVALLAWSPASAEPSPEKAGGREKAAGTEKAAGAKAAGAKAAGAKAAGAKAVGAKAPGTQKAPATQEAPDPKAPAGKARSASPEAAARAASGTGAEPSATPPGAQRLDLTPSRLFGADRGGGAGLGAPERRSGVPLGEDGGWKTHAAQAGVMAVGFAALVALCKSGGCMLPSVFGEPDIGPSPDLQIREPVNVRSAR